jgi:hypothetical protein
MPSTVTISAEELHALRQAAQERDALRAQHETLRGELRVITVERDLLQERLKAFQRQLFAASSEARGRDA